MQHTSCCDSLLGQGGPKAGILQARSHRMRSTSPKAWRNGTCRKQLECSYNTQAGLKTQWYLRANLIPHPVWTGQNVINLVHTSGRFLPQAAIFGGHLSDQKAWQAKRNKTDLKTKFLCPRRCYVCFFDVTHGGNSCIEGKLLSPQCKITCTIQNKLHLLQSVEKQIPIQRSRLYKLTFKGVVCLLQSFFRWVPLYSNMVNPNSHFIQSPWQTHLLSLQCYSAAYSWYFFFWIKRDPPVLRPAVAESRTLLTPKKKKKLLLCSLIMPNSHKDNFGPCAAQTLALLLDPLSQLFFCTSDPIGIVQNSYNLLGSDVLVPFPIVAIHWGCLTLQKGSICCQYKLDGGQPTEVRSEFRVDGFAAPIFVSKKGSLRGTFLD